MNERVKEVSDGLLNMKVLESPVLVDFWLPVRSLAGCWRRRLKRSPSSIQMMPQ